MSWPSRSHSPESHEDLHDPVEVPDVPGDLGEPEEAVQDRATSGAGRLGDDDVHDPLTHLKWCRNFYSLDPVPLYEELRYYRVDIERGRMPLPRHSCLTAWGDLTNAS